MTCPLSWKRNVTYKRNEESREEDWDEKSEQFVFRGIRLKEIPLPIFEWIGMNFKNMKQIKNKQYSLRHKTGSILEDPFYQRVGNG